MATVQDQIDEAREAYHALQIGQAVVTFRDANGEELSYNRASIGKLAAYIRELENLLVAKRPILAINFHTSKGF